ncbi:MAG: excinuclease ABC subunit UvrA [Chitinophagales bacterium]|nr:excinuclease ABC subunit UvrA [Chitinophagales bacterium]MDW8426995.1 excinuclease ABC subunit UvrA [Chitinophagales bacterium]
MPAATQKIFIKGARTHNLKSVDVEIPRNRLVVVTGVSGSGKSSLTMDTLYAEGQRRYVESLSAYARQFLTRMNKPDVDYIKGIMPAIAIEQRAVTRTTRSTVGTLTEIYDFLSLLFARIGKIISPVSGREVRRQTVSDVVDELLCWPAGTLVLILAPVRFSGGSISAVDFQKWLTYAEQRGFRRLWMEQTIYRIDELLNDKTAAALAHRITAVHYPSLVIDRIPLQPDEDTRKRLADSVQTAFQEGDGTCQVFAEGIGERTFSNRLEADGIVFEDPTPQLFHFNNPYGACKACEGFGTVIGIDENLVIPNRKLSVYEGAVACWNGEKLSEWKEDFIRRSRANGFPVHKPIKDLTPAQYRLLWEGDPKTETYGINDFFRFVESQTYKIQYRVLLARYRGKTTCPECRGSRLRKEASYVQINAKSITDLVNLQVSELEQWVLQLKLEDREQQIAGRLLQELRRRLRVMNEVGLGYLTLHRLSATLSGGELQRIHLTRILGSNLTSSLYILDEPSVGLHPRDTHLLIGVLRQLRDLGNTVVVVEHDEEIIRNSDYLIDMGPEAGIRGGRILYCGPFANFDGQANSLTAQYLSGQQQIPLPERRRSWRHAIYVKSASAHNLKNIDVTFPLNVLTVVTGVSGSGKSTLVTDVLYPLLSRHLAGESTGHIAGELGGDVHRIQHVELVDQNPLGRSSRSNPVTYVGAYDYIRELFARQPLARQKGLQPRHFSFNVEGGRCETCKGEGTIVVEMQFLADVHLVCETCEGKRFRDEILEVTFREKTIAEVLDLTVDEALDLFWDEDRIVQHLLPLQQVGMGYVKLGQSSATLSGGEAQRVKLASFLTRGSRPDPTLFIFDEPTTGLHFHDIRKLLLAFDRLLEQGHTLVVIEHHLDVIKCADHVIDLGPEGGEAGGYLVFEGVPEKLAEHASSHTGRYLRPKLMAANVL